MVCSVCGMYLFLNSLGCVFFHDTSLVGGLKICSLDLSGLARLGDRESFGCRTSRMNSGSKRNKSQFGDRGRSQHIIAILAQAKQITVRRPRPVATYHFHCFLGFQIFGYQPFDIIFPSLLLLSLLCSPQREQWIRWPISVNNLLSNNAYIKFSWFICQIMTRKRADKKFIMLLVWAF